MDLPRYHVLRTFDFSPCRPLLLVPQRAPLSPPLLAAACLVAAVPAAWIALGADALVSGAAGSLMGFPWSGLSLSPHFTVVAMQAMEGSHPPALWVIALLVGPAGSALLGLGVHLVLNLVRSAAWLRVLALEWAGFAALRLPALLIAGVLPGGRGPVDDLYRRLGEPQSGRWAVALLAVLSLWGVAVLVTRLAVGAGRDWMRIDGRPFRRHLVRVVAGYPALASLAAWSAITPWAGPAWMAGWLLVTFVTLMLLTA
jgi:hypothetical protein